jgi:hypothetical protein
VQLKFNAREDQLVREPGIGRGSPGAPASYVGRTFDAKTRGYPAIEDAVEVDSDSDRGRRLAELCRRDGSLWPANRETAEFCGVEFVEVAFKDGVWSRKSTGAGRRTVVSSAEGSAA